MPNRPIENPERKHSHRNKLTQSPKSHHQHGHHHHNAIHSPRAGESLLLGIPPESLTHITSFLDPASLLAFARTNKRLHEHVSDDNTWRRAYVYQFLGITPESNIGDNIGKNALMLRREEGTWRKEFLARWNLRRRWERSRNTTITHVPLHSTVASMYLMPSPSLSTTISPGLLTSSLQYGVVSRSYPLTGKVLRGYFDAAGTLNGLGIGNPNAEFTPDLTKCALSAEGGTAKVLWGFRNGMVAVSIANKAMEGSRAVAARWMMCAPGDCHEGAVEDLVWASTNGYFVSAGADGRVKLWDSKRMSCLWTSELKSGQHVQDAYIKVAIDATKGVIVGVTRRGEAVIWSGFRLVSDESPSAHSPFAAPEVLVSAPMVPTAPSGPYSDNSKLEIKALYLQCQSMTKVSVVLVYQDHPYAYRVSIDLPTGDVERVSFGDSSFGSITCLQPIFSTQQGESSFIIVGDQLGCISVFPWDGTPIPSPASSNALPSVPAAQKFEAHEDGAVCALAWTPTVLVSGSSRGTVKAWDSLTFAPLRTFSSPAARPGVGAEWDGVSQILVERDFMVVSVGSRVMAWRAGPVGRGDKSNMKGKHARGHKSSGVAKWHQHVEMHRDIAESRHDLEKEQAHTRQVLGREREQRSTLEHLGLSEVEAVEYVLMLSRDEAEARRRRASVAETDQGVFLADFDEIPTPMPSPGSFFGHGASSSSLARAPSSNSPPLSESGSTRSFSRPWTSISTHKVQVSPRLTPEPMEAGFSPSPSESGSVSGSHSSHSIPSADNPAEFPSMASTPTNTSTSAGTPAQRSVSESSGSYRSAWSTPLRSTRSSEAPSPSPRGVTSVASSPVSVRRRSGVPGISGITAGFARRIGEGAGVASPPAGLDGGEEDEDLKFALELSLAEARSRGEDV